MTPDALLKLARTRTEQILAIARALLAAGSDPTCIHKRYAIAAIEMLSEAEELGTLAAEHADANAELERVADRLTALRDAARRQRDSSVGPER